MKNYIPIVFLLFCQTFCLAQNGGKYVYSFLNNPNSARIAANGGILIAHNHTDLDFVWQNPAALTSSAQQTVVLNYSNYFQDISAASAAFAFGLKKYGMVALTAQRMGYGEFIAADASGNQTGSFRVNDNALGLSWSYALVDSVVRVGLTAKGIFSQYEQYSSNALAADIGLSYQSKSKLFAAAIVLRNLGKQIKPFTEGTFERLPMQVNLGVSKKLAHAPFRFNLTLHNLQDWNLDYELTDDANGRTHEKSVSGELLKHVLVGVEFALSEKFFAAGSYNFKRRDEMTLESGTGLSGFAWGFGASIKMFRVRFASTYFHQAGSTQTFSIGLNLQRLGLSE